MCTVAFMIFKIYVNIVSHNTSLISLFCTYFTEDVNYLKYTLNF